jgi:hypothetical protein
MDFVYSNENEFLMHSFQLLKWTHLSLLNSPACELKPCGTHAVFSLRLSKALV